MYVTLYVQLTACISAYELKPEISIIYAIIRTLEGYYVVIITNYSFDLFGNTTIHKFKGKNFLPFPILCISQR